MPNLIDLTNATAAPAEAISWAQTAEWDTEQPLLLNVDEEVVEAYLNAPLIGIDFPAFNDGRGLSLAVLLRTRFGYNNEIRAVGAIHEDLLHYLQRCGFSTAELPDDRSTDTALACLQPHAGHYQGSVTEPRPKFRRA